ncbi:MAG: periplasmic heavy metal sensor [Bacteroidetes bacterium]|nr:periplasmic heavy metal sensor [Bacteroidota bacterium]
MSKDGFYKVVVIALLLLNIGTLGYLWQSGKQGEERRHGGPGPAPFIIEKLQLDDSQKAQFEKLRDAHHERTEQLRHESAQLHDALFSMLKNDVIDSAAVDSLNKLILVNVQQKEALNFNHFKELKSILKPEQYKLYDEFIEQIARQFAPPPPPGRRP